MTFLNPRTENQKFHLAFRDSEDYLKRGKMVNRYLVFDNNRAVSSTGKNERVCYKISDVRNQIYFLRRTMEGENLLRTWRILF